MKTVLITGGGGSIGKRLVHRLLNNTSEVSRIYVFDIFISSAKDDFVKLFGTEQRVTLCEYDITDRQKMDYVKVAMKFDEIYHLASLASPYFYKMFPLETLEVGYMGTKNILEIAKHHHCKVLFSSTSEVYGDPNINPQDESYNGNVNSFGVRSSYDESKRVAEALCYTYINTFDVDIKIARIFNTYGPGMMINDGRIVTQCLKSLINNTTLEIYGTGEQTRSCVYIDDTVDMLHKLMASNCNVPVNVGNDEERTINETVRLIEKVYQKYNNTDIQLKVKYTPLTQDDPLQRQPCLKLNKEILGTREYTTFEKGIEQMLIDYLK